MNNHYTKNKKVLILINSLFFIIFLIIGFYTYQNNGSDTEPTFLNIVNINHFSTFFGGSSAVLAILLLISMFIKIKNSINFIFYASIIINAAGTIWFTWDDEIATKVLNKLQYSEIYGNLLGFILFVFINSCIYLFYNKSLDDE